MNELKWFEELITNRLYLRKLTIKDAKDLFLMRKDPKMIEFTDGKVDQTIEDTIQYIHKINQGMENKKWLIWAMVEKQTEKVVGTISLWNFVEDYSEAELGYGTSPAFQRLGYMKEALQAIMEYGFERLSLHYIHAYSERDNLASIALLKQIGFTKLRMIEEEGYFKKQIFYMDHYRIEKMV